MSLQTRSRRSRTGTPEPYDFRRPMTLARDIGRLLEMALERFARQWGTQYTARLRVPTTVMLESIGLRVYDEFVNSLPSHTTTILTTVEQTRQSGLLQFDVPAALVWVDHMLGGNGMGDARGERELTEIEWVLVKELLQHSIADLAYAFAQVTPLDLTLRSVQYNPQFVQVVGAADNVLVCTFSVKVGDRTDVANLMLPAEPLLSTIRASREEDTRSPDEIAAAKEAMRHLDQTVRDARLDVAVRFEEVLVAPRDVVHLQVGDVLPLHHPVAQPLDVVVDGVLVAKAAPGSQGHRLACQIVTVEENLT